MHDVSQDFPPPMPVMWKVEAGEKKYFVSVHPDGDAVWASRNDYVMLKIDRDSGKVLGEYEFPLLWTPSTGGGLTIDNGRAFLFTTDGLAYSLELKPVKR